MPDFLSTALGTPPTTESPWRRRLTIALVAVAVILALLGTAAFVASNRQPGPTPGKAAKAMCTRLAPDLKLTGMASLNYALPDVGKPAAVVVVPSCLKNKQVADGEPGHYFTEINVYVMVSRAQLVRLLHIDGVVSDVTSNVPYSVEPVAVSHLLSAKQMQTLATGSGSTDLNYFITDGPVPDQRLADTFGWSYLTAPYDLLSGTRYAHLPFRQMRSVYEAGYPITLRGK
jgi:hypothetical protein